MELVKQIWVSKTEAQVQTWTHTPCRFSFLPGVAFLRAVALIAAVCFVMQAGITGAQAEGRRPRPYAIVELPPTEGRGCYYDRGEEYCGSYCYWEINGKRYCQRRLRDAHSQAGPEHFYIAEPRPYAHEYGMK